MVHYRLEEFVVHVFQPASSLFEQCFSHRGNLRAHPRGNKASFIYIAWICGRWCFTFCHGKSPWNHHLGEFADGTFSIRIEGSQIQVLGVYQSLTCYTPLKLAAKAPENRPKPQKETSVFQPPIFSGAFAVSFREGNVEIPTRVIFQMGWWKTTNQIDMLIFQVFVRQFGAQAISLFGPKVTLEIHPQILRSAVFILWIRCMNKRN